MPELDCASPGFHVKHVDTELSVIAEARRQRRTHSRPRWEWFVGSWCVRVSRSWHLRHWWNGACCIR